MATLIIEGDNDQIDTVKVFLKSLGITSGLSRTPQTIYSAIPPIKLNS